MVNRTGVPALIGNELVSLLGMEIETSAIRQTHGRFGVHFHIGGQMELLSFYENPKAEYPYSLVLNNLGDGYYHYRSFDLDAYMTNIKFTGFYRYHKNAYHFMEKSDAMMVKLGWQPEPLIPVSGPAW